MDFLKKLALLFKLADSMGLEDPSGLSTEVLPDEDEKKVGDKVKLTHFIMINYMHEVSNETCVKDTEELDYEKYSDLIDSEAIVAETNSKFKYNCGHCDHLHKSDLIIYYPHNEKKYYISSRSVKLINKE